MISQEKNEKILYACEHIITNENVLKSNATIWDTFKDNILKQMVLIFNFDFVEISKNFEKFFKIDHKKSDEIYNFIYNPTECRRHWGFLHAMRILKKNVDENYYINVQNVYEKEKIFNEENIKKFENEFEDENKRKIDLNKFYDELFEQKVDKEKIKFYENEIKYIEQVKNKNFPVNVVKEEENKNKNNKNNKNNENKENNNNENNENNENNK